MPMIITLLPDSTQNRIYTTQRIENPPVIDGKLDDACWEAGEWQSNYKQFIPDYNSEPTFKTELKVLYNNKSLFVAIRAYDDMDKITKRLGRRDNYLEICGNPAGQHTTDGLHLSLWSRLPDRRWICGYPMTIWI